MANFKCAKCSTAFTDDVNGIVCCPECGCVMPLPMDLSEDQKEKIYNEAILVSTKARLASNIEDVISIFEQLGDYEDSYQQAERCRRLLVEAKKNEKFALAISKMEQESVRGYKDAIALFEELGEWKGSSFKLQECQAKLETLLVKKAKRRDLTAKITMIVCAALIVIGLLTWAIIQFLVPAIRYSYALNRIEKGEYEKGYAILTDLGDYKNAPEEIIKSKYNRALAHEQAGELLIACDLYDQATGYADAYVRRYNICLNLSVKEQLSVLEVGSTILMGVIEQDESVEGKEKVEWIIVDRKGDEVTLVSKRVIHATTFEGDLWSESALCAWLNAPDTSFFTSVFARSERSLIIPTTITTTYFDAEGNQGIDMAYESYVYLPSYDEVQAWFKENNERCAEATAFVKTSPVHINEGNNCAPYWLRNTNPDGTVMYVGGAGVAYAEGRDGANTIMGLRPVIKVNAK